MNPSRPITKREGDIIALVAQGLTNKELAQRLGIALGTVKVHLHTIFDKLGVTNRTELASAYYRRFDGVSR